MVRGVAQGYMRGHVSSPACAIASVSSPGADVRVLPSRRVAGGRPLEEKTIIAVPMAGDTAALSAAFAGPGGLPVVRGSLSLTGMPVLAA